jgi:hypothetical protein
MSLWFFIACIDVYYTIFLPIQGWFSYFHYTN